MGEPPVSGKPGSGEHFDLEHSNVETQSVSKVICSIARNRNARQGRLRAGGRDARFSLGTCLPPRGGHGAKKRAPLRRPEDAGAEPENAVCAAGYGFRPILLTACMPPVELTTSVMPLRARISRLS